MLASVGEIIPRTNVEEKYLVTCGASAGLAAAFNAPLAGAIFALEELHKFFSPLLLVCVLVASGASNYVTRLMLGTGTVFRHDFILPEYPSAIAAMTATVVFCIIATVLGKAFSFFL